MTQVGHNRLKQRLLGAIVLVSLGVIFIPMLLTERGESDPLFLSSNIPAKPERSTPPPSNNKLTVTELKVPTLKRVIVDVPTQQEPAEIDEKIVTATKEEMATLKVAKSDKSSTKTTEKQQADKKAERFKTRWVVQVGSFGKEKNALSLRDQLRKKGYTTFVESIDGKRGKIYRVRVGPELTMASAEKLKEQLVKKTKLKGLVVQYP